MADYQTFFNISHDLFCVLDRNGYYKNVNPAFFSLLNYSEEELTGHPFVYFVHPDDVETTLHEYEKAREGKRNKVIQNRFRSSDGSFHWISWTTIVADDVGNFYSSGQNISAQKRMEEAHRKAQEEGKKQVTKAIIQTQESERSKISLELHDNVNQVLTTVKLLMDVSQDNPQIAKANLGRAIALQQEAITEIQNISRRLSAPSIGNLPLADSIRELVHHYPDESKLAFSLALDGLESLEIDQYIHMAFYRILQEQLTNIVKHAKAQNVQITLRRSDDKLVMEVVDDGQGFDPEKKSQGIGIQNMKARVESANGTFSLTGERGKGTRLLVAIPLE
jgi:PAS domain S-box-containing protein